MTGYSVDFLGCKVSQTDAEQIAWALTAAGHDLDAQGARIRVVNTCCITAEAEKKSRKTVRRLVESGDDVQVFVTGCGATLHPETYDGISDRVVALPGGAALSAPRIVQAADRLGGLGCKGAQPAPGSALRRSRAFVKVQDGCSFECSYCVVPIVRGTTRSRALDAIRRDVATRVAQGRSEIVLTGINIGLFREPELRIGLPKLLAAVADVDGVSRVRISSIEVNHVDRRLVAAMADEPKVCPHLHVPLQSGDPDVLRAMHRHYTADGYRRAIERACDALPELNLTTDVIVGYPTEDDASFERTLSFCGEIGFTKIHAFPYSPRPGTETADANPVPKQVKRERSARLRAAADARANARWYSLVGRTDEVLVEDRRSAAQGASMTDAHIARSDVHASARLGGYLRDYTPVAEFVGTAPRVGALAHVEIVGVTDGAGAVVRAV